MMLSGDTIDVRDYKGEPIRDDTFLILFNAHHEAVTFVLPGLEDVALGTHYGYPPTKPASSDRPPSARRAANFPSRPAPSAC